MQYSMRGRSGENHKICVCERERERERAAVERLRGAAGVYSSYINILLGFRQLRLLHERLKNWILKINSKY
jgi:hypothetical protein